MSLVIHNYDAFQALRDELNNIIDKFVSKFNGHSSIVQGSPEWKLKRCKTIGGSEIAIIVLNDFDIDTIYYNYEVKNLILSKIGINNFNGSIHTRWGNLFEPVIADYFEQAFDTKIKGDEIHISEHLHTKCAYSPDGIAVVDYHSCVNFIDDGELKTYEGPLPVTALIEFKSPWSRIPNGEIPKKYYCQVLAGLDTLRFCQIGIYCEGVFRICSIPQWNYNNQINTNIHSRDSNIYQSTNPIACGFILFYNTNDQNNTENKTETTNDQNNTENEKSKDSQYKYLNVNKNENNYVKLNSITDFGEYSHGEIGDLFYRWHIAKQFSVHYAKINLNMSNMSYDNLEHSLNDEINKLVNLHVNINLYGILPYKTMQVDVIDVHREHGYIKKHHKKISSVIDIVTKCNQATTPYEKMNIFNELCKPNTVKKTTNLSNKSRNNSDSSYNDGYDDH